jgi:hypothetical protein
MIEDELQVSEQKPTQILLLIMGGTKGLAICIVDG